MNGITKRLTTLENSINPQAGLCVSCIKNQGICTRPEWESAPRCARDRAFLPPVLFESQSDAQYLSYYRNMTPEERRRRIRELEARLDRSGFTNDQQTT